MDPGAEPDQDHDCRILQRLAWHAALIHAAIDFDAARTFGSAVFHLPGGLRPTTGLDLTHGRLR
jgi:hypothetical protein